jgi:hypothetical protein
MATEYQHSQYYDHELFVNIHTSAKIAIEYYLAKTLLKKDLTRVVYAKDEICFRRRMELLDTEKTDAISPSAMTLNLPFISFFQGSNWKEDANRNGAGQMVNGIYCVDAGVFLRSMQVEADYNATCFFGRDDDARVAQQILTWEQNPQSPTWIYNAVTWRQQQLLIPTFVTFESIEYNPDYNETAWLDQSRIIPIQLKLKVHSSQILMDRTVDGSVLPMKLQNYDDHLAPDAEIPLTEESILGFLSEKNFGAPEDSLNDIIENPFSVSYFKREGLKENEQLTISPYAIDIVKGYFSDTTEVTLNAYSAMATSPTSLRLTLKVKPADQQFFSKLVVLVPGHDTIEVTDCKTTGCDITGLSANSEYHITILAYSVNGDVITYNTVGTTLDDQSNQAPTAANKKLGKLVGTTW